MGFALSFDSSDTPRRRSHESGHAGPRRSERLELVFAQIGMALSRRAAPCDDATRADGDEPSVVDRLLGRRCSQS